MLASIPASMLNQNPPDLGIPNRIDLKASRFSIAASGMVLALAAPPTSATAAITDPIFALVEAHRSAAVAHSAACAEQTRREQILIDEGIDFAHLLRWYRSAGQSSRTAISRSRTTPIRSAKRRWRKRTLH
jgi:hypothetical protein